MIVRQKQRRVSDGIYIAVVPRPSSQNPKDIMVKQRSLSELAKTANIYAQSNRRLRLYTRQGSTNILMKDMIQLSEICQTKQEQELLEQFVRGSIVTSKRNSKRYNIHKALSYLKNCM